MSVRSQGIKDSRTQGLKDSRTCCLTTAIRVYKDRVGYKGKLESMIDQIQWDPHTPRCIDDIVGNHDVLKPLAEDIRKNLCPHIVLCGPQGCGKSLFIRVVLELEKQCPTLHIECTANAGLRDLRDLIRGFARGSRTVEGDFRWIVLEHADSLAGDTQAFLRRMMETTAHSTRFLFECTDAGAISEPILSRSVLYTLNAPTVNEMMYEIQRRTDYDILTEELDALCKVAGMNMRNALYYALAHKWNSDVSDVVGTYRSYMDLIAKAPSAPKGEEKAWMEWGLYVERECRHSGLDCRELLHIGWPTDPNVSYMRTQWSRLGGISARALFFRTLHKIARSQGQGQGVRNN